jgi:hypothetical protein
MNFKKGISIIVNDEDYKVEDYHQAILNLGYNEWQKKEGWEYSDMLDYMNETYGDLAMWAVLIGKANQQICNGGFVQYFDNGYASEGRGGFCSRHNLNLELHHIASNGIKETDLIKTEVGGTVHEIFEEFYIERDEEEGYILNDDMLSILDDRYYEVNEEWEKLLNHFFKVELEKVIATRVSKSK